MAHPAAMPWKSAPRCREHSKKLTGEKDRPGYDCQIVRTFSMGAATARIKKRQCLNL
jgi:hypothetical protein